MPRPSEAGRIQFTTVLFLLAIGVAGYLFWALVPAFSDNYELRQGMATVVSQAWHHIGKEQLHKQVMDRAAGIGTHLETPEGGGEPVEVRGLPISDDDVVVTCTDQNQDCSTEEGEVHVDIDYHRAVPLPYLKGQKVTLHFTPSVHETLKPAQW